MSPLRDAVNWPGRARKWCSVKTRKERQLPDKWEHFTLREGEKGPIDVRAFSTRVETKRDGAPAREETLLVMQAVKGSQTWYFLAPGDGSGGFDEYCFCFISRP